jgi:hypothetical protein
MDCDSIVTHGELKMNKTLLANPTESARHDGDAIAPVPQQTPPNPTREPVRLMLVGSRKGVTRIIHRLHILGFAEADEWSPILPGRNSGEVMRVLTRHIVEP